MPDPIESAFQKVVENAQLGCDACQAETAYHGLTGDTHSYRGHTCDATIDAAAEGMLAAVDSLQFLNIEGCGDCQDTAQFDAKATINRLREEAKK